MASDPQFRVTGAGRYRLKTGEKFSAAGKDYQPGDIVELTDDQVKSFGHRFEPAGEGPRDTDGMAQDAGAKTPGVTAPNATDPPPADAAAVYDDGARKPDEK